MSNIAKRGLTAQEIGVAQMLFQGRSYDDIAKQCYNCLSEDLCTYDKKKIENAKKRIRKLLKNPQFQEYYKVLLSEASYRFYGKALQKIGEQIDSSQEWLANKAANDILTRLNNNVVGDQERSIVVRVEGMPELGTPDAEDVEK